jgi:hypothetical protein
MMIRCFVTLFAISLINSNISGQSYIKIEPTYESKPLILDSTYSDQTRITSLRFYIGNIKLMKDTQIVFEHPSYQLMDAKFTETLKITVPKVSFNKIAFSIGIDSLTNNQGALTDDLDPQNGMYWTWQSGYINFKLEGEKVQPFTFHIGGYLKPFNAHRSIISTLSRNTIYLSIDSIMRKTLTFSSKIMSPSKDAMRFANLLSTSFSSEL